MSVRDSRDASLCVVYHVHLIDITGELHEAYKLGTKQQGVGSVWFGEVYEDYMPEGYWDQDNDNDANITLRFGGLEYWRNAEFRENIEKR